MTLAAAVEARKNGKAKNGSADKNPAYYNREKAALIKDLCEHDDPIVRTAILTNVHCPSTRVNSALKNETDKDVLRALLLSGRPSVKSIIEFATSDRGAMFDDDTEVENHVKVRLAGEDAGSGEAASDAEGVAAMEDGEDED